MREQRIHQCSSIGHNTHSRKIKQYPPLRYPLKRNKYKYRLWRERKSKLVAKKLKEEEVRRQNSDQKAKVASSSDSSKHEGGLVFADKIFKPLDTLLIAYKSRLKSENTLKGQWEKSLDLELKKQRFAIYK